MMIIMRYEKGHKATTRERIVRIAAGAFRRKGLGGVGVATLMQRAGLTHGGFYSHFPSRDALVRESLQVIFPENNILDAAQGPNALEKMIRYYLRPEHRDQPEFGCPLSAFLGEMPRQPKATREVFSAKVEGMVALFERALPAYLAGSQRRQVAQGITAVMVGSLQMARATTDPKLSRQILESGIKAALALAHR